MRSSIARRTRFAARPSRACAAWLALALLLLASAPGCGHPRRYERVGTAGAILAISGVVINSTTRAVVPEHETATRVGLTSVGAVAQIVGWSMVVYGLDGMIRKAAEANGQHVRGPASGPAWHATDVDSALVPPRGRGRAF